MYKLEIPVPPESVGAIIGKGGANIKELQHTGRKLGANIELERGTNILKIRGPKTAIDKVEIIVRNELDTIANRRSTYPESAVFLLEGFEHGVMFEKQEAPDNVESNNKQTYCLADSSSSSSSSSSTTVAAITSTLASASLDDDQEFFIASATTNGPIAVRDVIAKAARKGTAGNEPGCKVKVRFNLGTQFFYASQNKSMPSQVNLSSIQRLKIGPEKDLKAVFSNIIEQDLASFKDHLKNLGLTFMEKRETLSCHLKDNEKRHGISLRFKVSEDSIGAKMETLSLDTVKSSNQRLCSVSHIHPHDARNVRSFRFKLIKQTAVEDENAIRQRAATATWNTNTKVLTLPNNAQRFTIGKARRKSKQVYEGTFQGNTARVSIVTVTDENGTHTEIAGTNVDWNQNLTEPMLYDNTVAFCRALVGL